MAITEQGLTIRRFPEVEKDIQENLLTNLNTSLVFDSDTLLGQLVSIIGAEVADEEALIQAVYDSFDIDKAEGVSLDRLVSLIGVTRLGAAFTNGTQQFTGADGTNIPLGSVLSNPASGDQFETLFSLDLAPSSCESVIYSVPTLLTNTVYTVTVNGNDFNHTSSGTSVSSVTDNGGQAQFNHSGSDVSIGDEINIQGYITNVAYNGTFTVTAAGSGTFEVGVTFGSTESVGFFELTSALPLNIINGLVSQINLPANRTWEASNVNNTLKIITLGVSNIAVSAITYLLVDSVTASTLAQATVFGTVRAPASSVNNSVSSIAGLSSTTNPLPYTTGRNTETDEELRGRAQQSTQLAGSSTVPANLSTVSNVEGVTTALLIENLTSEVDSEGRPPHSYEVIVEGGADSEIAQAIFNEKPAGIQTFGDITVNVLDLSDTVRAVSFSRPEDIIIAVKVTYTLYDEEQFPATGVQDIVNTVVTTGNDLGIGTDVINTRFFGPIYSGVSGINSLIVETQILQTSGDSPINATPITGVTDNLGAASFNHSGVDPYIGQRVTLSGFAAEASYNVTGTVSLSTPGSFELTGVTFAGNDTGSLTGWLTDNIGISNSQVGSFTDIDVTTVQL